MGLENPVAYGVILSGSTVSDDIGIVRAALVGLLAPTITSGQLFIQGNFNTTSAGFVRIGKKDGTGDFAWSLGVGSNALNVTEEVAPFSQLRLETSVAQTDTRTFTIINKL